jgi:protoporphyrinogen oxidase
MTAADAPFDLAVLGAGLRGLHAALRERRARPDARIAVLDAAPQPGGSVRTQRTNGFVCELGPFAFGADELRPHLELLAHAPPPVAALASAANGWLWTGGERRAIPVDAPPLTFRSGNEELVQAYRRELGDALRLGRSVVAIDRDAPGTADGAFTVGLGGEVPAVVRARELAVALPAPAAATLLGRFDPALAAAAARVTAAPMAMAFFGGSASEAAELTGYGIVPATPGTVREAIFCSQVFAGRALPGRFLARVELAASGDVAADLAAAERELRIWTGTRAEFGLRKLHPFAAVSPDGASVEVDARLRELGDRVPGLRVLR